MVIDDCFLSLKINECEGQPCLNWGSCESVFPTPPYPLPLPFVLVLLPLQLFYHMDFIFHHRDQ